MPKQQTARSRPFFLELVLNLVIFTFCAAVCLQVFAAATTTSTRSEELSHLTMEAQSLAEAYKSQDGDVQALAGLLGVDDAEATGLKLYYDEDFVRVASADAAHYCIMLDVVSDPGAGERVRSAVINVHRNPQFVTSSLPAEVFALEVSTVAEEVQR